MTEAGKARLPETLAAEANRANRAGEVLAAEVSKAKGTRAHNGPEVKDKEVKAKKRKKKAAEEIEEGFPSVVGLFPRPAE